MMKPHVGFFIKTVLCSVNVVVVMSETWKSETLISLSSDSKNGTGIVESNATHGFQCHENPCVRKCCESNQIYKKINKTNICDSDENVNVSDQITEIVGKKNMTIIHDELKPDCKKRNGLVFELDEYDFLSNGTLISITDDNSSVPISDYCFEFLETANKTIVFKCYPSDAVEEPSDENYNNEIIDNNEQKQLESDNEQKRLKIYPYCMLISVPFLLITVIVYVFIKELRNNLAGKCFSRVAGSMAISFILLSIVMRSDPEYIGYVCKPTGNLIFLIYNMFCK